MKVLVDMDGVLSDFVSHAADWHNKDYPYGPGSVHNGNEKMESVFGMTPDEFWPPLEGFDFWYTMKPMPEAFDLMSMLETLVGHKNIAICTAQNRDPQCAAGKMAWVNKYFPTYSRQLIITPIKHFLAKEDTMLIDDRQKMINKFRQYGGHTVLYPRWWNVHWRMHDEALDVVNDALTWL